MTASSLLSVPHGRMGVLALAAILAGGCRGPQPPVPGAPSSGSDAPVLTPQQALKTFALPPGYRIELVAAEPLVQDPVAVDFDPDGRMYVVEMRGYMPNLEGEGEERPVGRVVVLEDDDRDGRMDRRTIYMDSLVLPRAVRVLEQGVLVAAPPYLWLTRDTDGDLRADTREVLRDDYGTMSSNPEHNANGLVWGLDNWLHNAKHRGQYRFRNGRFEFRDSPAEGQWGVSMDEQGRLYRNSNEDPLRADLVPSHYFARNPNLVSSRGAYERLTPNGPVWPIRPTPGVNRGYRERTLRDDSTLAHFTAAGSPTVYVGDRLPAELRGDVFVTEPAGNLVRRFEVVEGEDGSLTAHNAYEEAEFLASTDERFRPVNVSSAPDGTLYVVDMYRGIIQHRAFITDYLENQIRARGLEQPIGLGRIYRIVHRGTRRGEAPRLSAKTPAELVGYLSHPNGWWRMTAQRMLVERGDRSVAPALRQHARSAADERTRLHALWTLEGLDALDPELVASALSDSAPRIRAAAVRLSEPWLAQPEHPLQAAVLRLCGEQTPVVRRQVAASLGELHPSRREAALADVLSRHGADPIVRDLVVSGLHGREAAFLERLLAESRVANDHTRETVPLLTAAVVRSRDAESIDRVLGWLGEETRPQWQRLALLAGVRQVLPRSRNGERVRQLELERAPAGLLAAAESRDTAVSREAAEVAGGLTWPGKPVDPDRARAEPLTPEQQRLFQAGEQKYLALCAACHQPNGQGATGVAKALVDSEWVLGAPHQLIRILLHGKEGEALMPPLGAGMADEEVAAVLTYIRRSWGNEATPISPAQVEEVRGQTRGRHEPWTEEELRRARR